MASLQALLVGALAALATAQVTLTPSVIRGGRCPLTVTSTSRATVTAVSTATRTSVSTVTSTVRQTVTSVATVTKPCGAGCPTLTSTATACKTCLIPQCTTTVAVTKPCGCDKPATTTINLGCDAPNVCNRIGCKTVYNIRTAGC